MAGIDGAWLAALRDEFKKPYYKQLYDFVKNEYATQIVYPPSEDIFNAFHHTPLPDVKVVILGQDPYHEPGQAMGLAFSVPDGVPLPPSLKNIYQELQDDLHLDAPVSGDLRHWADQGVFLLNTVLTVRAHAAYSHKDRGWETFTDAVIRVLNGEDRPIVFLLWGRGAGEKSVMLNNPKHLVLKAPHPSPLSAYRGFFGCRHFSRCNSFLEERGIAPVVWA